MLFLVLSQGFICPMCKLTLPSAELLTAHFDREHDAKIESDPNPPQQGSVGSQLELHEMVEASQVTNTALSLVTLEHVRLG